MNSQPMKPTINIGLTALAGLLLLQAGCSVLKPKADLTQFYVLRATPSTGAATTESKPTARSTIRVSSGRLAAYLDVTPVVVQDGSNRVKQLDLHHWAEPLSKGISRVFGENLAARLNGAQIIIYPEPANATALELRYTINRLEGTLGGPVILQVNWQVVDLASGTTLHAASTDRQIPAAGQTEDVSAYVDQISAALVIWADEVAAAIRALHVDRQP